VERELEREEAEIDDKIEVEEAVPVEVVALAALTLSQPHKPSFLAMNFMQQNSPLQETVPPRDAEHVLSRNAGVPVSVVPGLVDRGH
jgi:hypothetical protein